MTLTTSTTHGTSTITARLDTETLRVSLDVDGIDAGSGKWRDGITDTAAQLVRDNDDATDEVYSALDAGLRAQLVARNVTTERTDEYMARTNAWHDCGGAEAVDADDVDASLKSLAREFVADAAASGALIDLAETESYVRARWVEHVAAEAARPAR